MKNIIFVPIKDYFISRKKVFIKFLIPILIALIALLLSMFFNIGNSEKLYQPFLVYRYTDKYRGNSYFFFCSNYYDFSICRQQEYTMLKGTESNKKQYKPVNGKQLSLFQILLSNIAYNAIIEIIYLVGLITLSLVQNFCRL